MIQSHLISLIISSLHFQSALQIRRTCSTCLGILSFYPGAAGRLLSICRNDPGVFSLFRYHLSAADSHAANADFLRDFTRLRDAGLPCQARPPRAYQRQMSVGGKAALVERKTTPALLAAASRGKSALPSEKMKRDEKQSSENGKTPLGVK